MHRGRMHQKGSENHRQKTRSRPEEELGRGMDVNVLLMDAPNTPREEEFARSMGQMLSTNDAAVKGAQIKPS